MAFSDALQRLRKQEKLTQSELADKVGLSKSAISMYERGAREPDFETAELFADYFNISLNLLIGSKPPHPKPNVDPRITYFSEEFPRLSDEAQGRAYRNFRDMVSNPSNLRGAAASSAPVPSVKVIPLFGNSFAAGVPEPDFGNMWEDYEVPADSRADFAVRVHGDSMEPYLPDGSVALGIKGEPKDGDVVALLLDGEYLVKQVCQDSEGTVYLFSLNRAREDCDIVFSRSSGRSLTYFGKILMKPVPLP